MELWLPFFELLNGKRERTTWSKDANNSIEERTIMKKPMSFFLAMKIHTV